jgi:hypothetical protein
MSSRSRRTQFAGGGYYLLPDRIDLDHQRFLSAAS